MRIVLFIIGLFLAPQAWAATSGTTVDISGETVVPPPGPTSTDGATVGGNAGDGQRLKDQKSAVEQMPFFCEVQGKCPNAVYKQAEWILWKPTAATLNADCQRACRNPCIALGSDACAAEERICTYAFVESGTCYLASSSPVCPRDGSSAVAYIPGSFDPSTGAQVCPSGVPAPGLPEDKLSLQECMVIDKECDCAGDNDDVWTRFEPELRTCKATLETQPYAGSAFYDEERHCHLRRCRCMGDPGDDSVMKDHTPKGTEPHVYTITRVSFAEKEQNPVPCPGGGQPYVPEPNPYYNDFCEIKSMKCNMDESTDVYALDDSPKRGIKCGTEQKCRDQCANLFVCGGAYTYFVGTNLFCVQQRDQACPRDNWEADPTGKSSLYLRIKKADYEEDRVKNDLAGICKEIRDGKPTVVPWSEKFCGFDNSKCDLTPLGSDGSIHSYQACLTACYNQGDSCQGANLDANGCTLLSARCDPTSAKFLTGQSGSTYYRRKQVGEDCKFPEDDCADKYQYIVVEKSPRAVPALVGTCGNGGVATTTDRRSCPRKCGGDNAGCKYHPTNGCECPEGDNTVWSDAHNACVPPAQCMCQQGTKFFASNAQKTFYSYDCKQRNRCEVPTNGYCAHIVSIASNVDSLCGQDRECYAENGVGYCVCRNGQREVNGSCQPVA